MKPAPFEFESPTTVAEAVSLLQQHGEDAKIIAGGQSLVPLLNLRLARPGYLIDINRMAFGKVGIEKGCENFKLLYMLEDSFHFLAEEYAKARGFDTEKCFELMKPYIRKNG